MKDPEDTGYEKTILQQTVDLPFERIKERVLTS
jgi:hypothetical protein